jgi:hypothetical protein
MLHVEQVKYIRDYTIWVAFNNGIVGQVNLEPHLNGDIFLPLKKNKALFSQLYIDPELETIAWSNGADIAPEFLLQYIQNSDVHP